MFDNQIVSGGGGGVSPISTGNNNANDLNNVRSNVSDIRRNLTLPMSPTEEDVVSLHHNIGDATAMVDLTKRQSAAQLDLANKQVELANVRMSHVNKSLEIQNKYQKMMSKGLETASKDLLDMRVGEAEFNGLTRRIQSAVKMINF